MSSIGSSLKTRTRNFFLLITRTTTLKIGFTLLILLIIPAMLEPVVNNYLLGGKSPLAVGLFDKYLPASYEHPLGTDQFGRDLLAVLLIGLRYSWFIGLMSGGIATLVAVVLATAAGYIGGKVDSVLNSVTNAVLVIPSLPILIAIAAYVRMDLVMMSVTLAVFSWPYATRTIRAQILSLKERGYVNLAKISGLGNLEIMFFEVLPNLIPFIGVGFASSIVGSMVAETGLRLLGLGPGEIPSLGLMLNWALQYGAIAHAHYNVLLAPALTLILIFLSFMLINTGLEETFNPRLKKITGI